MIKFKLMNMAKSATFLNVCKSGFQTQYNLDGFKDSKQFNIKGTQRLVYTHNVNLMTPSTKLCINTDLHRFCRRQLIAVENKT